MLVAKIIIRLYSDIVFWINFLKNGKYKLLNIN